MISLSLDLKIMISAHIISGQHFIFKNDIKSLPGYRYKRGLGLRRRLVDC